MNRPSKWHLKALGMFLGGLCIGGWPAGAAQAQAKDEVKVEDAGDLGSLDLAAPGFWRAVIGPYTLHLHGKPEFRYVWAAGVERQRDDLWLYGATYFSNSFGQDSGYLYFGRQVPALFDQPKLYFQWTVGLLYGYRGEFRNRVPLNHDGFSPGAVLSLGWEFDEQFAAQINQVGTSGLMLQLSYSWR